jgi:EmrB/QacA subfamily drug resistance transporter
VANDGGLRLNTPAGRWVLVAAVLGSGVVSLDATVVNVALPTIGRELHAGVEGVTWTINGYSLTLAALILLGGALGDRYGRRRIFVLGVIWFGAASLLCGIAPNLPVLIAARALQGVGGALLTPGSLAMISASFAPEDRGRAIGAWSGLGGLASAAGPLVAGLLLDLSWRLVFLINLPLTVLVIALAIRHVPESLDEQAPRHLDLAGASAAVAGLAGITYALTEAPGRGPGSPLVLAAAAAGIAGMVLFLVIERRGSHPLIPLDIFASRQFTAANLVTFALYAALGGVFLLLALVLQISVGMSPLVAGSSLLPITVIMLALSARAGALASRIGPRRPMTFGPLVVGCGLLLMLRIGPGAGYLTAVLPAVIVFGLGLALTVAPLTAAVLGAAAARHAGVASGVNNAVARTAGLLAVAVLPAVTGLTGAAYQQPLRMVHGFHIAIWYCLSLVAASSVIAWFGISDTLVAAPGADQDGPEHDGGEQDGVSPAPVHAAIPGPLPRYHCSVCAPPQVVDVQAPPGGKRMKPQPS